jgi:hypothetical protein
MNRREKNRGAKIEKKGIAVLKTYLRNNIVMHLKQR